MNIVEGIRKLILRALEIAISYEHILITMDSRLDVYAPEIPFSVFFNELEWAEGCVTYDENGAPFVLEFETAYKDLSLTLIIPVRLICTKEEKFRTKLIYLNTKKFKTKHGTQECLSWAAINN